MNNQPRQLLDDSFIQIAYDQYGDDIKEWPTQLKDQAVAMAKRNGTDEQTRDILFDFVVNDLDPIDDCKAFYSNGEIISYINPHEAINLLRNSQYAAYEHYLQLEIDDWIEANITPRLMRNV